MNLTCNVPINPQMSTSKHRLTCKKQYQTPPKLWLIVYGNLRFFILLDAKMKPCLFQSQFLPVSDVESSTVCGEKEKRWWTSSKDKIPPVRLQAAHMQTISCSPALAMQITFHCSVHCSFTSIYEMEERLRNEWMHEIAIPDICGYALLLSRDICRWWHVKVKELAKLNYLGGSGDGWTGEEKGKQWYLFTWIAIMLSRTKHFKRRERGETRMI